MYMTSLYQYGLQMPSQSWHLCSFIRRLIIKQRSSHTCNILFLPEKLPLVYMYIRTFGLQPLAVILLSSAFTNASYSSSARLNKRRSIDELMKQCPPTFIALAMLLVALLYCEDSCSNVQAFCLGTRYSYKVDLFNPPSTKIFGLLKVEIHYGIEYLALLFRPNICGCCKQMFIYIQDFNLHNYIFTLTLFA